VDHIILGDPREESVKTDLKEIGFEDVDWIQLA
jgi:hypothetical protein